MERSMKKILVLLAALVLLFAFAGCGAEKVDSAPSLAEALAAEGDATIQLTEDLVLTERVVVKGNKVLTGSGTVTLDIAAEGEEIEGPAFSLLGCPKLTAEDYSAETAVLQVSEGASLTLGGDVIVDAAGVCNGIAALKGATVTLQDNAAVQNGRNCGIYVCEEAALNVTGGSVLTSMNHGVVNNGTMTVTGGTLSGAECGAVIFSNGTLEISEGVVTGGGVHNVYVAAGSANITGGRIDFAAKDGVVVASGASANVTGGAIENCGTHGLCNSGTMETGAVVLYECGIANNATGTLNMVDTVVEISPVYCLANMGGTVTATNFSALSCDVTSICNFAGDMTLEDLTVTGSRAGNISNESGNLTVNNATLGLCREKPINVGNGVVKMDNITVEGTSGEYFGAFIYGGEFYLSNSSISFINYSALRADGDCYVELTDVVIDDTMASGIWSRGATIVGNNITMTNVRGHAINNAGGNVTITNLRATDIGKNAIIQDNGVTTLTDVVFRNVGDQGAYVKNGQLNINDGGFYNVAQNGVYIVPAGEGMVMLEDVTYTNVAKYGLNNGHALSAVNVRIYNAGISGILNKEEMYLRNVTVKSSVKDCIYNDKGALLTVQGVVCDNPGDKSTAVFNRGEIWAQDMTITNADHALINKDTGVFSGEDLEISNITNYGIRNQGRIGNLYGVTISDTGNHGINNEAGAYFQAEDIVISNVQGDDANAIYNYNAVMEMTNLTVNGGKSHGIFNRGTVFAANVTVNDVGQVSYYNYDGGISDVTGLVVNNSGNHALCNLSEMILNGLTVNTTKGCGIMNGQIEEKDGDTVTKEGKAGNLTLNGEISLNNTASHGLANVQHSVLTGSANVNITSLSNTSANGVYNRGSDLTAGNITISGYKYGVSNTENLNTTSLTVIGTANNGVHNTGSVNVSGNVNISNVYGATTTDDQGNGIYNAKDMTVGGNLVITDITAAGADTKNTSNNALCNKGNLTVAGNVDIGDVAKGYAILSSAGNLDLQGTVTVNGNVDKANIIQIYSSAVTAHFGKLVKTSDLKKVILQADGSVQVTIDQAELVAGADTTVIQAKGSSAEKQSVVTLKNAIVTGHQGSTVMDAVGGVIVLENTAINGFKYAVNVRNYAYSKAVMKGNVTIENGANVPVYVQKGSTLEIANGANVTINANAKNAVVLNATGSALTMGSGAVLNINNCNYAIHTIADTVYNGDATSVINVNTSKDTAIMLQGKGSLGTLNIINSGKYGLSVTGTANVQLAGVNVNGAKNNGYHNAGVSSVSGNVSIVGVAGTSTGDNEYNGIYNTKTLTIGGNLTIGDINTTVAKNSSGNGIFSNSTVSVGGNVTIGNAAKYAILQNKGSLTVTGTLTVNGTVGGEALVKVYGGANATFGAVNKESSVDKIVVKADNANTVVTVNGGTINGGSSNHIFASFGNALININNVTTNGGKYALDAEGGNISAQNVTLNNSNIAIYVYNTASVITIKGVSAVNNTSHATSVHVKGTLIVDAGATLTIQNPTVGMKIYKNATLELKDGATVNIASKNANITKDSPCTVTKGEGAKILVNGEEK